MIEKMNESPNFPSSSVAMNWLIEQGYKLDFNLKENCIYCSDSDLVLSPSDFEIDRVFRFEGATNPADQEIVYAISSKCGKYKGVLFNAYGVYADKLSSDMIKRLTIR